MTDKREKILFVEDDKADRAAFERFAKNNNFPYDYILAGSVKQAFKILGSEEFDAVVIDYLLGDGTAFDLLKETKAIPSIIITGKGNEDIAAQAIKSGASDYLIKDFEGKYLKILTETIKKTIDQMTDVNGLPIQQGRGDSQAGQTTNRHESETAVEEQAADIQMPDELSGDEKIWQRALVCLKGGANCPATPARFAVVMAASVFFAEMLSMFLLHYYLPQLSITEEVFIDSFILVGLILLPLYFFLFRPLVLQIDERKQAELALKKVNDGLEVRVKEKTTDIITTNKELQIEVDERRVVEKALQRSRRELKIKNRIAEIFITIPDDQMYAKALQVILDVMESKYGFFGYIDRNGNLTCPSMTIDVGDECRIPNKDIVFSPDEWGNGIWGRALTEKKAFYSNEPFNSPHENIPISGALAVPMADRDNLIGIIVVGNKRGDYDDADQAFLESIVNHITPVLYARLQRDKQEEAVRNALTEVEHLNLSPARQKAKI